jgi:cysteine-rich repeat protein
VINVVSVCTTICGDGKKKLVESCDDGNSSQGLYTDGCVNCVEQPNWNCAGGGVNNPDFCTPTCGNVRSGNEACDDGNTISGDGCSSLCAIETGYACTGALQAPSVCVTICGDGRRISPEQCDDFNLT